MAEFFRKIETGGHKLRKSMGQIAYEAFALKHGLSTEWGNKFPDDQKSWEAAAQAVLEAAGKPVLTFEPVEKVQEITIRVPVRIVVEVIP
jgi:hypothetical protein